jgi:excisionase family DNA binding protein
MSSKNFRLRYIFLFARMRDMELLTTEQAAEILGISVARVKQLLAQGKLEGKHVGKQWIIERKALDAVTVYGKAGRPPKAEKKTTAKKKSGKK